MTDNKLTPGPRNLITDVAGLSVGNAEDERVRTGVTVVLPEDRPENRIVAGLDVRGGAPGTRETDALDPARLLEGTVDALVLSGGSVYGLDAASGVVSWLGARGRGYTLGASAQPKSVPTAPIVPAAILFDLANGGDKEWGETPPYRDLGRAACDQAGQNFALGNAGAGFGAQAGLYKGGLGSASAITGDGFEVGALVAVNAFGAPVIPGTDCLWAAPYEMAAELGGQHWPKNIGIAALNPLAGSKADAAPPAPATSGSRESTTIGIVALNAELTPGEASRIATMAHDGLARALRPVHAPVDGDVIFVVATAKRPLDRATRLLDVTRLGAMAADCVARAIGRGIYEAQSLGTAQSYRDRHRR